MNYAEMSDFEINNAVHNALLDEPYTLIFHGDNKMTWKRKSGGSWDTGKVSYTKNGLHDYCNNPEDAWPIIVENKIDLAFGDNTPHVDRWGYVDATCWKDGAEFEYYEKGGNPLRAAMVVFLMMMEGEGK